MRILYITNDFPFPLTSGHLRHYFLLRELAAEHEVTLLSIVRPSFTAEHRAAVAPFVTRLLTFTSSTQGRTRGEKLQNQLRAVAQRQPIERASVALRNALLELEPARNYDVALVSGRRTVPALSALEQIAVVADICDADSMRLRTALRFTPPLRAPLVLLDYMRVVDAERQLLQRANHLLFASPRDRDALCDGDRSATVVPNGVDLEYWKRTAPERGRDTVIFTGAMQYGPNADAATWLIEHVLPLVRRQRPNARLLIVGRDPSPQLRRAGALPEVTVTGAVPDVRPYLEQASVFVAPLRFGAGIQNKVLEALAMEVPVIASPIAAAGLITDTGERPPVQVAGDARDFAQQIVNALRQADTDASPHAAGRQFVSDNFAWSQARRKLESALLAAVQTTGGRAKVVERRS